MKCRVYTTDKQIIRAVNEEVRTQYDKIRDRAYADNALDIQAQMLGVFLWVMANNHGFGKRRLTNLVGELRSAFHLTNGGATEILGKDFTTLDVVNEIKRTYGIDAYKEAGEM